MHRQPDHGNGSRSEETFKITQYRVVLTRQGGANRSRLMMWPGFLTSHPKFRSTRAIPTPKRFPMGKSVHQCPCARISGSVAIRTRASISDRIKVLHWRFRGLQAGPYPPPRRCHVRCSARIDFRDHVGKLKADALNLPICWPTVCVQPRSSTPCQSNDVRAPQTSVAT